MRGQSTTEIGKKAEEAVAGELALRGMKVLARNLRRRYGEIDIVALDRGTVVFVEVRARRRGSLVLPEESVDWQKRRRITRMAAAYLSEHRLHDAPCRLDLAAVDLDAGGEVMAVRLIESAFELGPRS